MRAMAPHMWRFWYQWMILTPGVGYRLHTSGKFVPKVLAGGSVRREVWDDATLHAFSDTFTEPARARAAVQMYRVFNLREAPEMARGRYADAQLKVPTRLLFGTGDQALKHTILAGYERHAEDMLVEKVEGCGHFIADERPDLVAKWAREFFE
jgi:pimeloyl-ACP methyl ester carboxylesterase